ncbi:MAG: CHASE2 domain-containing protein [Desulfobacter sp.]|nr:MAG: CHASE2 domain-containing protein [Desulfobacter sp.]
MGTKENSLWAAKNIRSRHLVMGLGFLMALGLAEAMGLFLGMDFYAYDLFFRLRGAQEPPKRVLIAAVDEKSLGRLGRWPISRRYYADFLQKARQADGILADIILAEPGKDDARLKSALEEYPRIILPAYVDRSRHLVLPSPTLGSPAVGHVHTEPGMDGVVRQVFHTLIIEGQRLPSAASALDGFLSNQPPATAGRFRMAGGIRHGGGGMAAILQEGGRGINYYGPPGTIPSLSFSDILENKYPPVFFKNKILVLGLTAAGIDQDHLTSFSQNRDRMPGVELQATVLANLLDGSQIRTLGKVWQWAGIILAFMLCALWFARLDSAWALASGGLVCFLFTGTAYLLFAFGRFWIPPTPVWAAFAGALVLGHIIKLEAMGRRLIQARQDWETSFDAIADAIIIRDRSGRPVLSNRSAANGALEVLERHGDGECGAPSAVYDQALDRYFELQSFIRPGKGNRPSGSVHVVRDVTERTQLRQQQKALEAQLIQSQKMEAIGTLAGGIAHDFNNILSAIMGYTQLAAASIPDGEEARKNLEEVLNASSRAADLVAQILSFSRRTDQKKAPLMVRPIVKEIVQLLKGTLPQSIRIKADVPGKEKVFGEAGQIYQVILNLCTNAYQAIGNGPGEIKVIVERIDVDHTDLGPFLELAPGPYVKISVSDTGSGIPEKIRNRVFEPYFTTKEKETGTGLGLATTHGIVKNHGGSIRFDSSENEGTCFHVYLPMAQPHANGPIPPAGGEGREWVQGRLLLVDDREALVETGSRLLENMGYDVTARNCPQQALADFKSGPEIFDAVITDLYMKKMTGIALTEKLLEVRPDIPVILCTGYHDILTKEAAAASGVSAVVEKPYSIRELSWAVQSVMAKGR